MSAIGLLVLVSMFGQVGVPTLPLSTPSASQGEERDFGWQISNKDGALEYIVQLSPQVAEILTQQDQSFASHMPPELVGRATRVVVQFGTGILPRVPSLEELDREPRIGSATDLQAALGPGRISDVEAESLRNVQGGLAPLPSFPNQGALSNASDNWADRAAAANLADPSAAAQQLRDNFLSGARNNPSTSASNLGAGGRAPAVPSQDTLGQGSKFNSTAPLTRDDSIAGSPSNLMNPPGTNTALDPRPSATPWPTDSPGFADNRDIPRYEDQPTADAWNTAQTDPRSLGNPAPQYASPTRDEYPSGIAQRGQMPGRSLAEQLGQDRLGYSSNDPRSRGYTADGFPISTDNRGAMGAATGFDDRQGAYDEGYSNAMRAQDSLRTASLPGTSAKSQETTEKSPGDETSGSSATKSKANNDFLQVFIVLSLVVNIYLGMLIRKLLMRYRSLLASVRSQTA